MRWPWVSRAALEDAERRAAYALDMYNQRNEDRNHLRDELTSVRASLLDACTRRDDERTRLRDELTALRQQYHEMVLKATTAAAPTRVEDAKPDAEARAMHAVSVESKLRLADRIVAEALSSGRTIDYAAAFTEATTMMDHPENILLST